MDTDVRLIESTIDEVLHRASSAALLAMERGAIDGKMILAAAKRELATRGLSPEGEFIGPALAHERRGLKPPKPTRVREWSPF